MGLIRVNSNNGEYKISIERDNLLSDLGEHLKLNPVNKIYLITDENVESLYGDAIQEISKLSSEFYKYTIKPGESSKSPAELINIWEDMATKGITRSDAVVAFGGGVVGDLAGFVAASYLRGVRFIQLPTTLLSQVDSSVGGKVAVDLKGGKNLAGAFYSPELVVIDTTVLTTLTARTLSDGMAEVLKYGFIDNPKIFELSSNIYESMKRQGEKFVETIGSGADLSSNTHQLFKELITECCSIKAEVVENDETEKGRRAILNFGHTIGHAIEAKGGYEVFTHGEAISIGMIHSLRLGKILEITEGDYEELLTSLLYKWKLPTQCDYKSDDLMKYIFNDKKAAKGGVKFVFISRPGEAVLEKVSFEVIENYMKQAF